MRGRFSILIQLALQGVKDPFVALNVLELRSLLLGQNRVLDVGCGNASPLQYLGLKSSVGIDGYPPAIEAAKKAGTHSEFRLGDIRELTKVFAPGEFTASVALDVIEHLPKPDGYELIRSMSSVSSRRVIFLTPNGFLPQHRQEKDDLQEHLSGWAADEMKQLGFQVIGMLGPKKLRGEFHRIRRQPRSLWALVSLIQQLTYTRRHPESAAAILCYKDLVG